MEALSKALRYGRTLRYLKPSQIVWRARRRFCRALMSPHAVYTGSVPEKLDPDALDGLRGFLRACARHHPGVETEVQALRDGRVKVLGDSIDVRGGIPWDLKGASRLARYTLQYMDFVRSVAQANCQAARSEDALLLCCWMDDWIAGNPPGIPIAWDAFPISSRLMNWYLALSVHAEVPERIRRSLAQQTDHLLHNLEYDVLANHLLKNAQALVVAGSVLGEGSEIGGKALRVGRALLDTELQEQILSDGGHYERSPMYHCHVLEDNLIAYAALKDKPVVLADSIRRMALFLARIVHPEGEFPLFGDSALSTSIPAKALLGISHEMCDAAVDVSLEPFLALKPSGYYVMTARGEEARMIVKAGEPGPPYQLGHAHGDMLSFELSIGRQRVIVDSGVSDYETGPMRAYCRSTRAHNTVSVNGRDMLECWDAFRVGRRYRPVVSEGGIDGGGSWLCGSHDAFAPYRHERLFVFHKARFWIIKDVVEGPGEFTAESFLHFHPDVVLQQTNGCVRASCSEGGATVVLADAGDVTVIRGAQEPYQGWYCPEFGMRIPSSVLALRKGVSVRAHFIYAIFPGEPENRPLSEFLRIMDKARQTNT